MYMYIHVCLGTSKEVGLLSRLRVELGTPVSFWESSKLNVLHQTGPSSPPGVGALDAAARLGPRADDSIP